jgi:hypothetical protein
MMNASPITLRQIDLMLIDDLFEMGGGYVLNFNDPSYSQFFRRELGINIDDAKYKQVGASKAKRLRCLLNISDNATIVRTLRALWDYREAVRSRTNAPEKIKNAERDFLAMVDRLEGNASKPASFSAPKPAIDRVQIPALRSELLDLSKLTPQDRGYGFEKFLTRLFQTHGLQPREPFRNRGEQIDGSFQFGHETYLLEAKWHASRIGADHLHVFHGKLEQKAAWARGLFISESGFTTEGLEAFGRAKRFVCMDGLDLYELLDRALPLDVVLERKVRHAAETGLPFVRIRDLFP